jgi:hypothetical protein
LTLLLLHFFSSTRKAEYMLDDPDDWPQLWLIAQFMSCGGMRWMGELKKKDCKRIVPKHAVACVIL